MREELADEEVRKNYLFLQEHPEFEGFWGVESFSPSFYFDLKDVIGPWRVVSPSNLESFLKEAEKHGYKVAFFDDPNPMLEGHLNDPPPFSLTSPLENTINGLLPYQLQGFNFLKDLEGGVLLWSTGTGKTVCASALLKYHQQLEDFDLAFVVVKSHNKINTQRMLKRLAGIESIVITGDKKKREKDWAAISLAKRGTVVVTNYEKFRHDHDLIKPLFEGRDILCIWDEMPTKLKNRSTQIYQAVCECLYRTNSPAVDKDRIRPKSLRQWMLSATPIENSPEDFFNTVRLLDPTVYGTVANFRNEYVAQYSFFDANTPVAWRHLDKMGIKAAHITHQVDKSDPDIAKQFPKVIEEPYYVDWDDKGRKIYDLLTSKARQLDLEEANILALITVMQMMCDAPSMVRDSAILRHAYNEAVKNFEELPSKYGSEVALKVLEGIGSKTLRDEGHPKLETLRQLLTEDHKDEKVLVFSTFHEGLQPILKNFFDQWGVSYVTYHGSDVTKQEAHDTFMEHSDTQVFLSSDMGSDSLSLERASVVIHYDLPWKWSTFIQRQNRVHRVVSDHDRVRYYTLMMADSIEDRKMEIIRLKQAYHEQVFKGAIAEQAASARLSQEDFRYILLGEQGG